MLGGWNLAGYARYTSGSAYSFTGGTNLATLGYGTKTANYVGGAPIFATTNPRDFDPATSRYFAPGAFVTPPLYEFGNTAPTLDWVRGFTQKAESISLGKAFPVKERLHGQFRIDVNNPFNFVRWGNANGDFTSADYGRVTTAAEGRKVQLYLTFDF